ncbi:MAG TPA: Mur ligase family protein [Steroidobacteraceae bacterium]|nr:Mur ligase family protein [Steroidobacteraceae bacterium]
MPFEDSRRLTGCNLFFASTGAVLELAGIAADETLLAGWRARAERARTALGWTDSRMVGSERRSDAEPHGTAARLHASGAAFAVSAPCDQLFTATEVNEWALCAALYERDPLHWASLEDAMRVAAVEAAEGRPVDDPPVLDETQAIARLRRLAAGEARPDVVALIAAADAHDLPHVLDETVLTLGAGAGSRSYPLDALPQIASVPWGELRDIPTAVVTGSNGKTTTVRLVAACARAQGWKAGYNCTDGVVIGDETIATGDYAGPAGARMVMRDPRAEAAVLETARGGILRRGIAVSRAHVAVVTNVSPDHFGEYGIHDLAGLADVKLSVASVLGRDGLLVLNADDPILRSREGTLAQRFGRQPRIGWFALDADAPHLQAHRGHGGWTCGVRDERLRLSVGSIEHDLGLVSAMPLTVDGSADYNIANLGAAALASAALGVAPVAIAAVFATFGAGRGDNDGRLMRFDVGGVHVLVDYAHNPDGIRGLLRVATHLRRRGGRLGLLLGHAGNRQDAALEDVARVAAGFGPDLVVVKEDEAHLRGRAPGEVPRIIRDALLRHGLPPAAVPLRGSEMDAVRCALDWARPGDVLALPVHGGAARKATIELLSEHHAWNGSGSG